MDSQAKVKADRVPPPLRNLLNMDVKLTKKFVLAVERSFPAINTSLGKNYMKALELSCHGIPWFAVTLITIYLIRDKESREVEMNLLFGLIYDIMLVAFVKAFTRRTRPSGNGDDGFLSVNRGPDKFSFPSGHASRAVWVALFFTQWALPEMSIILKVLIFAWATAICVSRVLMRRHHLFDVAAGVGLGYAEFILSGILWVGPEACKALGDWIATSAEDEYVG